MDKGCNPARHQTRSIGFGAASLSSAPHLNRWCPPLLPQIALEREMAKAWKVMVVRPSMLNLPYPPARPRHRFPIAVRKYLVS